MAVDRLKCHYCGTKKGFQYHQLFDFYSLCGLIVYVSKLNKDPSHPALTLSSTSHVMSSFWAEAPVFTCEDFTSQGSL